MRECALQPSAREKWVGPVWGVPAAAVDVFNVYQFCLEPAWKLGASAATLQAVFLAHVYWRVDVLCVVFQPGQ